MLASVIGIPIMLNAAFAQSSQTQIWTDAENNAEIVFTYSNPVASTPTIHMSYLYPSISQMLHLKEQSVMLQKRRGLE